MDEYFDVQKKYLAVCNVDKNFFLLVNKRENLDIFFKIGGQSQYIGREGIEFYPQELMVFQLSDKPSPKGYTCLRNIQKCNYELENCL